METGQKKKIFDDRYEILSIVGRGSRSVVYQARHIRGNKSEVALKVLLHKKGQTSNSDLLRKEALAMVSSRHQYVIRLDDFHSVGDLCYLSMEFAPEADLRKFVNRHGERLLPARAELYLLQTGDALHFIHQAGLLHRDLKPDNILVIDPENVRIGDFGVAILPGEESSLEDLQRGVGTMNYMAPEVLEGKGYSRTADIYSLATAFYEMLTGVHPFEEIPLVQQLEVRKDGNFADVMTLNPNVPHYLSDAIMRCMRYNPADRFQTAKQLIHYILDEKEKLSGDTPKKTAMEASVETAQEIPIEEQASGVRVPTSPPMEARKPLQPKPDVLKSKRNKRGSKIPMPGGAPLSAREAAVSPSGGASIPLQTSESSPHNGEPSAVGHTVTSKTKGAQEEVSPGTTLGSPPEALSPGVSLGNQQAASAEKSANAESNVVAGSAQSGSSGQLAIEPQVVPEAESAPSTTPDPESDPTNFLKSRSRKRKEESPAQPRGSSSPKLDSRRSSKGISSLSPERRKSLLMTSAIVIFLLLILPVIGDEINTLGKEYLNIDIKASLSGSSAPVNSPLPKFSSDSALRFPSLPSGMYAGTASGILPGRTVGLSMISFAEEEVVYLIVAIPGWKPATISLTEINAQMGEDPNTEIPLRVASNGIILQFTGRAEDGSLIGVVENVITGSQGKWMLSPIGGGQE